MKNWKIEGCMITRSIVAIIIFLEVVICSHLYFGFKKFNSIGVASVSCVHNNKVGVWVPGRLKPSCFVANVDIYHVQDD